MASKLIRDVARGLKYQHLPEVVGAELTVDSIFNLCDSLATFAREHALPLGGIPDDLSPLNRSLAGPIGKYGIIDFEYPCDAEIRWAKTGNNNLLRELGFVGGSGKKAGESLLLDNDPEYCLRQLRDGMSLNQKWLKLFFHTTSIEFSSVDMKTRFRWANNPGLIPFPLAFRCVDACVTNAPDIWFNRHFYM